MPWVGTLLWSHGSSEPGGGGGGEPGNMYMSFCLSVWYTCNLQLGKSEVSLTAYLPSALVLPIIL